MEILDKFVTQQDSGWQWPVYLANVLNVTAQVRTFLSAKKVEVKTAIGNVTDAVRLMSNMPGGRPQAVQIAQGIIDMLQESVRKFDGPLSAIDVLRRYGTSLQHVESTNVEQRRFEKYFLEFSDIMEPFKVQQVYLTVSSMIETFLHNTGTVLAAQTDNFWKESVDGRRR